eukprot:2854530-Alexandrium_andersonii.AAC.1
MPLTEHEHDLGGSVGFLALARFARFKGGGAVVRATRGLESLVEGGKGSAAPTPISDRRPSCRSRRRHGQSTPALPNAVAGSRDKDACVVCTDQHKALQLRDAASRNISIAARRRRRNSHGVHGTVKTRRWESPLTVRSKQGSRAFANGLS